MVEPVKPGNMGFQGVMWFLGCRTKEGGWITGTLVNVVGGPWPSDTECLHCGGFWGLMNVDGIPDSDGCCLCRLVPLRGNADTEDMQTESPEKISA